MLDNKGLFILALTSVLLVTGCTGGDESSSTVSENEWKQIPMPFTYQNIQVPREIWQTVKDVLRRDGASESVLESFAVLPVSVSVDLMANNDIVLKSGLNYRVTYVEGGGSLDLFDYVVGKGPFNIRMIPELDADLPMHVFYVSDSPGKELNGKMWGNGCGKIFDLSAQADQLVYENGIQVTSSKRHYLHLMAGTFLFFQLVEERLFMSYIRILDSRYPQFTCQDMD